jgi:hypothetical protein
MRSLVDLRVVGEQKAGGPNRPHGLLAEPAVELRRSFEL